MKSIPKKEQWIGLLVWTLICFITGVIASIGSMEAPNIYQQLSRPDWAPPASIFTPVWLVLYLTMSVASWLIWRQGGFKFNMKALTLFLVQLILNALWSWLFFFWQTGHGSLIDIIVLCLTLIYTLKLFSQTNQWAALLMTPYLLWVIFAAFLNFKIWQLNPIILG